MNRLDFGSGYNPKSDYSKFYDEAKLVLRNKKIKKIL